MHHLVLHERSRLHKVSGVVGAELHEQRPVFGARREHFLAITVLSRKQPAVKHRGVGRLGSVLAAERTEGQLALVHHWSHDEAGTAELAPGTRAHESSYGVSPVRQAVVHATER